MSTTLILERGIHGALQKIYTVYTMGIQSRQQTLGLSRAERGGSVFGTRGGCMAEGMCMVQDTGLLQRLGRGPFSATDRNRDATVY